MSFSFVVEGHVQDGGNMDADEEKMAVQDIIQAMFTEATSAALFVRVGSFNPAQWAPTQQDNGAPPAEPATPSPQIQEETTPQAQ